MIQPPTSVLRPAKSVRYISPLRYPGGKARLANFVKAIFRANELMDGAYAEPYAGGASVALRLLLDDYAASIHINDIDAAVHAFWYSVLHETEALCRLVRDTRVTPREWERQRQVYGHATNESPLALGFATFFLNRTNRSGIIASGGMIGGREQAGRWRLDARYNRPELADRIVRIAHYRERIHLSNLDAIDFLNRAAKTLPAKSLVYLDPPYYAKGRRRLYANHYEAEDHQQVARLLSGLSLRWIVSYDNAPAIRRLYHGYERIAYAQQYTVAERQCGREVMFFSRRVLVPREHRPASEVKRNSGGRAAPPYRRGRSAHILRSSSPRANSTKR